MYPFRARVVSYTGSLVYRVKGRDIMGVRKTVHPAPNTFEGILLRRDRSFRAYI